MSFESWLKEQSEEVQERVAEGVRGLKLALADERDARKKAERERSDFENQARDAAGKLEGGVLLSKQEAQAWEAYKALGKPEEVKAGLEERDAAKTELTKKEREALLRDVAEASRFKFTVLRDRDAQTPGLEYEIRPEEGEGGKKERVVYVKVDGKAKPLTEYAAEEWPDYIPALQAEQAAPVRTGTRHVAQSSGNGARAGGDDIVAARLRAREEAAEKQRNPLVK